MGKKKKTLKQKKLAELRRLKEPHGETSVPEKTQEPSQLPATTFSYSFAQKIQAKKTTVTIFTPSSLKNDLRKTLFVSLGIMIFLILLSTLLQTRTFVLPLVSIRY